MAVTGPVGMEETTEKMLLEFWKEILQHDERRTDNFKEKQEKRPSVPDLRHLQRATGILQ
jgi:hypothetical protein